MSQPVKPVLIDINSVSINGGTQMRVRMDADAIEDYATNLSKLPPIQVVEDGGVYWLWDGFHTYHAYIARTKTQIPAFVTQGTLKDAIRMACSANQSHGVRRTVPDKRKAVATLIQLEPSWSDRQVADHVGVSHPFVASVRAALAQGSQPTPTPTTTPVVQNATPVAPPATSAPQPPDPVIDAVGNPLVEPTAIDLWRRRGEIQTLIKVVRELKSRISGRVAAKDPLYRGITLSRINAEAANLVAHLKFALPFARCPDCAGRNPNCKLCGGTGLVGQMVYEANKSNGNGGNNGHASDNGVASTVEAEEVEV